MRDILRDRLMRFLNRRERAYKECLKKGKPVPHYAEKSRAIQALRIQLQASQHWDLNAHVRWICAMRESIKLLLPYQFHSDPVLIACRKNIIDLLAWCDEQHTNNLFHKPNLNAA